MKKKQQPWTIKQQTVVDDVTRLTIKFKRTPDGAMRLELLGENLLFGNRTLIFDENGGLSGSRTHISPAVEVHPMEAP